MYLTVKQHDLFRTLLMGFEIPYRTFIARVITSTYQTDADFEAAMVAKNLLITPSSPKFLKEILPNECEKNTLDVPGENVLIYHFRDGTSKAVEWQYRSRRESWTPEMKEKARQKAKAYYETKRKEQNDDTKTPD